MYYTTSASVSFIPPWQKVAILVREGLFLICASAFSYEIVVGNLGIFLVAELR